MSAAKKKAGGPKADPPKPSYRLPRDGAWANAWKLSAALGVLGVLACVVGYQSDPHRFAFSWLFGLMTFLAIGLGCLFFVLGQHLSGAGWGVSLRRVAEFFMVCLPVLGLLAIPILVQMDDLYPWMHHWREHQQHERQEAREQADEEGEHSSLEGVLGASVARAQDPDADMAGERHGVGGHEGGPSHGGGAGAHDDGHMTPQHAEHEEIIESKFWFLDQNFFWARWAIYLVIWTLLSFFFFRSSTRQDTTRDIALSQRMESWAPLSTFAFALTLTFAAVDWMMSLEPTWFSTIFGVQYFAVSCLSSIAVMVLVLHGLRSAGLMGTAVRVDHFHDMGKLLFGFLVFWAYITFSQFMLIWYASIPEETTYYHLRWTGGWRTFSLMMVPVHFFIPFFLLISRNVKRRLAILAFGAAWVLVAHVLEIFWLVMPNATPGELSVHWLDVAALFAVGGIYLTAVFAVMGRYPLIPIGDPRLSRSTHLEVA